MLEGARRLRLSLNTVKRLEEVGAVNRILDQLLAGLIPIRCRIRDFEAVVLGNRIVLVHTAILDGLPIDSDRQRQPVDLVGVTEERLFWKDVRRVLFGGSSCQILCRLNYAGVRDSWVPVKLTNVLDEVIPGLGQKLTQFGQSAFSGSAPLVREDQVSERLRDALTAYGRELGGILDRAETIDSAVVEEAVEGFDKSSKDVESLRAAFAVVTRATLDSGQDRPEALLLADLRAAMLKEARLEPDGSLRKTHSPLEISEPSLDQGPLLDAEVIAIYW